jgi:cytochrome oxidase Cu insertion factor (SCO1/SenC/PrrC family)
MSGADRPIGRGRRRLVLLALLFAAPLAAATALYLGGWRPQGAAHHGELVVPPRPIAGGRFTTPDGGDFVFDALHGKWTLVYFAAGGCDPACERSLYTMRQVQAAQGKEATRLQRVLVVAAGGGPEALGVILRDYPGMIVLAGPAAALARLADEFGLDAQGPSGGAGGIYLLDPLGNLMMHYPAPADASGLRKDLARLLRLSRIG